MTEDMLMERQAALAALGMMATLYCALQCGSKMPFFDQVYIVVYRFVHHRLVNPHCTFPGMLPTGSSVCAMLLGQPLPLLYWYVDSAPPRTAATAPLSCSPSQLNVIRWNSLD